MRRKKHLTALIMALIIAVQPMTVSFAGTAGAVDDEPAKTTEREEYAFGEGIAEADVSGTEETEKDSVIEIVEIEAESTDPEGSASAGNSDANLPETELIRLWLDSRSEESSDRFGYIDTDLDLEPISAGREGETELLGTAFPSSYSSVKKGYTTTVKDQSPYGDSWSFAYNEAAETYMKKHYPLRAEVLSPTALTYFFYHIPRDPLGLVGNESANSPVGHSFLDNGGNSLYASMALSGWTGLHREQDIPRSAAELHMSLDYYNYARCAVQTDVRHYSYNRNHPLDETYSDINEIKNTIMNDGSVIGAFGYDGLLGSVKSTGVGNKQAYYEYCPIERSSNLQIQIVGWDDTIPAERFRVYINSSPYVPEGNGGWLARNSRGSSWPVADSGCTIEDPGYFWISYYDKSIKNIMTAAEFVPADEYLNNYHYDASAAIDAVRFAPGTKPAVGNVFRAQADEKITAINAGFYDTNVEYTAKIYKKNSPMSSPIDGTLAETVTGCTTAMGLYTIELPNPVIISSGTYFSAVISTVGNKAFLIEDEYIDQSIALIPDLHKGESYYSEDGRTFYDASDAGCCFRIKVFTKPSAPALTITAQPEDQTGVRGSTANFTVAASGTGLTYQWQWSKTGTGWSASGLATAKSATLEVPCTADRNGQYYRCMIKDSSSHTVYSDPAKLTVTSGTGITITLQPQNQTGVPGSTASFTVVASGTGLTYQWQWSKTGTGWSASGLATAKSATLEVPCTADRNGQYYRCMIKDSSSHTAYSDPAKLTVTSGTGITITLQPQNQTGVLDSTASFTVVAEGTGLTYQWQWSKSGTGWSASGLATAKSATLVVPCTLDRDGQYYRCVIKDSSNYTVYSDPAKLTVTGGTGITITTQPEDQTGVLGSTVSFTVVAEGTGLTYQWQWSKNGTGWSASGLATAKSATQAVPCTPDRNGQYYRCVVRDSSGHTENSSSARLTVTGNTAITITAQPSDQTEKEEGTARFTVAAEGTDLSYQWQWSRNGKSWSASGLATSHSARLEVPCTPDRDGQYYRCVVSDPYGETAVSNTARLLIVNKTIYWGIKNNTLTISTIPQSGGIKGSFTGTSYSRPWNEYFDQILYVRVGNRQNGDVVKPAYTYQWFKNLDRVTDLDVSGLNTGSVTDMRYMFQNCRALGTLDLSSWNTENVQNMGGMFYGCTALVSLDLSSLETGRVSNMWQMFYGCTALENLDLGGWNTESAADMSNMFAVCGKLKNLDLSGWETDSVGKMNGMFADCRALTGLDTSDWNTGNVADMSDMFAGCSGLKNLNPDGWNTENVTDMSSMFKECSALTGLNLGSWNTAKVTDMKDMFHSCTALESLDLCGWNTDHVTDMSGMFSADSKLRTIYASDSFSTDSIETSFHMFTGCTALKGGNGTVYTDSHTSKVYARIDRPGKPGYFTEH